MRFVDHPHLPGAEVQVCALSAGQGYIRLALEQWGIHVVAVSAHPDLSPPVAAHPDMVLHHLGGGEMLVAGGMPELEGELASLGFGVVVCDEALSADYPGDVLLNCFALGGSLYCRPRSTARQLIQWHREHGTMIRAVNQGYAKCSTCLVDSHSIITADPAIGQAAEAAGLEVLLITPGHIQLPGYQYGFVGGCCGLLASDVLAFTGELSRHPDGERIRAFCRKKGVEVLCLSREPLLDVGGILPLLEKGNGTGCIPDSI